MDAYDLYSGNGNNLSGYANEQVDGVIGALAVTSIPRSSPACWDRVHPYCGATCPPFRSTVSSELSSCRRR